MLWKTGRMAAQVAVVVAGLGAGVAGAQTIGDMAKSGAGDLAQIPEFIEVILYLCGVVLVGTGIVKFKQFNDAPKKQGLGGAVATLMVGAALLALPAVYQGISQTFGVDDSAKIDKPTLE